MNSKRSKKRKDLHNYDTTLTWINSIALYGSHMSGCLDIAQFQIFFRSIYIYIWKTAEKVRSTEQNIS